MAIQIKSFNEIVGDMLRKIMAETSLNDINTGAVLLTLLEAAASVDFENNTAILNVLELLNIDAVKNNDLDARASDLGLTRKVAVKASSQVSILNTNITKRSTGLYIIKPAPIAGQTIIYVNNTTGWASSGSLYIGRSTNSFEGPVVYTSIVAYPTYSQINLFSALQKDHLSSDTVIDSQGQPDRLIAAGTIVKIPANSQNPDIKYTTIRDATIPAGEDSVSGVSVVAIVAGSLGNAGINTITSFENSPFAGAVVTNTSAFSNGLDIETDTQLRNRLKSYAVTLARGTPASIISAIIGTSDPDENKQVASAVLTEPVKVGDPSILYIDDGSGLQPSYAGQSVDTLLTNATGKEEFLQLSNYPIPRPQIINAALGPFVVTNGSFLRVVIDNQEETIIFDSTQFLNASSATIDEIIIAINDNSSIFKARLTDNSLYILLYPTVHDAEIIQVAAQASSDSSMLYLNSILKFPTTNVSYITLYKNSVRLHEKSKSAYIESTAFATWNITTSGNVVISVDDTPAQDRTFALSDFSGAASFLALTLEDWIAVFNSKFAGLTASATSSQTMMIVSNKDGETSSITITGGTYLSKWFINDNLTSTGQTSQFQLNRQTGNLRIFDIVKGDSISAGIEDAKGFAISQPTSTGNYNLSNDSSGRPAEMIIVADSTYCDTRIVALTISTLLSISIPSTNTMRITSSVIGTFATLSPGDFIYITKRTSGWFDAANTGLYKIHSKGQHLIAGSDSYIDVNNINTITLGQTNVAVSDTVDIQAFSTDGFPQIWRSSYLSNPPSASLTNIIDSLNTDLINVKATIYQSNAIKLTSTTENNGSMAVAVSIANANLLFSKMSEAALGNTPHIANRVPSQPLVSFFKRTVPVSTNVWLDRYVYTDIKGSLSSAADPDSTPFSGTYSEVLQSTALINTNLDYNDYIYITQGNNRSQLRTIKDLISPDEVGTQQGTARTELDHVPADQIQIIRPIQLSSEDSIVVVLDKDPTIKTIDVQIARTGRVNSGSIYVGSLSFPPTTTEFSANDADNESSIDFSNTTVWGKTINNTEFSDYAIWMKARNWYATGGVGSSNGKMIVRSAQYGPNSERLRFNIDYPSTPDQDAETTFVNTPSHSTFTYLFGSGNVRPTALSASDTIQVLGPYPNTSTNFPNGSSSTGNYFDYTFSAGNFASVVVGDILSITSSSGVSNANSGIFYIAAKSGNTIRVFNPNASITTIGAPEVVTAVTIADIVGTPTAYTIDTVADIGGSLHQKYFKINDTQGSVAIWFDINNTGIAPPPHGCNRAIKVASIITGDNANNVASKIATHVQNDNAFTVSVITNQIIITNKLNGALSNATVGTSGFTVSTSVGTADITLHGKYFTIYDVNGSVAIWFDIGNRGVQEPFHSANRSIKISGANVGDSAINIASAAAFTINSDLFFTATNSGTSTITITNTSDGNVPAATANTSGFTVSNINGSLPGNEVIINVNSINIFPLTDTSITSIATIINASGIIEISAVGNAALTIVKATREEDYVYAGNSTALAFNHNPTNPSTRGYITMHDSAGWVREFSNLNPNFVLKNTLLLNGVAPSIYTMDTAPNYNLIDIGEFFKLIPTSVQNVYHHMTQKALSQLPIVANISISNDRKDVQITSKSLGSSGAIEVIGGNANKSEAYLSTESEIVSDINGGTLLVKIPAFPDTFNTGDYIMLQNDVGVRRFSRLRSTDSIDVINPAPSIIDYNFNPKVTNISNGTIFTITDVSSLYPGAYGTRPAGYVWRWTHNGGSVTLAQVQAGDLVYMYGPNTLWDQGNKAQITGNSEVAGLPIIAVNDALNYFDIINPHGQAMTATAVGVGNVVHICPTPSIRWNLMHASRVAISSISGNGTTITVQCSAPHYLNTGDTISIIDSINLADNTSYGPITVTSATEFTFLNVTVISPAEQNTGSTLIKNGLVPTRYKIEKLGYQDLVRISRYDGESPRFADCGVAVDDYIVIDGTTFSANNNGTYRVLAVDNESIIIINAQASDELNTITPFNNKNLPVTWATNATTLTGGVGVFKNVNIGDWVKKTEDPDTYYIQVIGMTPSTPALATSITLGSAYIGTTALSVGVIYDELNDYRCGVTLQANSDITIYEGDSVLINDVLSIQNIINSSWFNVNNIGSFSVIEFGTEATYKPFIRISNAAGVIESNRLMSINPSGLYVTESLVNKIYSIRKIQHAVIDDISTERRSLYLTPASRGYKFSVANATSIFHLGKLNYNTDVITGIDGYLYYTGLLRRVQRIVDGYEPDIDNFPGRRAVGGAIETLPPLVKNITVAINVATVEGVNLGDISSNIKSVITNYVEGLGVGEDVILSEITAAVMNIKGVGAVTFTVPTPTNERITIASNERAVVTPERIGVA